MSKTFAQNRDSKRRWALNTLILRPFAFVTLLVGLVFLPTPIPVGLVLIAFSLVILISTDRRVAGLVMALRQRSARVDHWVRIIEARSSQRIARTLRRTRPLKLQAKRALAVPAE